MSSTVPRDPYEVLGLGRDADESAIKKAFRKLARELHPDVNKHDPDAEDKFKEAAEAYEILSDADRRATFDRYGHDGLRSGGQAPNFDGFGSVSDLFDAFFGGAFGGSFGGGARTGPRQGDDIAVAVDIDLEQAYRGDKVPIGFEAIDRCEHCHGNGAEPGTPIETCERCGGQGVLQAVTRSPFGQVVRQVACDVCHGDGRIPKEPCDVCDGRGLVVGHRELDVDVPAGIADGQRIRISGRGHAGDHGGPPGDLYVVVQVALGDRWLRDADDLVTVADLAAPLAALGTTVEIDHPDGIVAVDVPAGTQPGAVITVKGKGMPALRRSGRFGDLRVVANVVIPRRLTGDQRELLERLAASVEPDQLRDDESMVGKLRRLFHR
ncbi:MAG TPA: J domain-containing protein [Baekduia sp.]|uniref:J domain-containing protein n=1 Tax=Baekduia sp. TaxID=2600305 RepID=UPI002C2E2BDF|nr:J domain-containing protein [Baekduia sp.]HMJ35809.1 J domain-containing protein [Baekduia sp.]